MAIDLDAISIVKITDHSQADALLGLMKRAMMLYAQETRLPLYKKDGSYTLAALNETRGDIIDAMDSEDFLGVQYHGVWVASVRLVSDPRVGKSLLTRFCVEPKMQSQGLGSILLETACDYLRQQQIRELYLYTAQENSRLMDFYRRHRFVLYSVNQGRPYPKVCLLRTL